MNQIKISKSLIIQVLNIIWFKLIENYLRKTVINKVKIIIKITLRMRKVKLIKRQVQKNYKNKT